MPYINAKIYSDGGHYVAIPQGAYPSRKGRQRRGKQNVKIEIAPPRDLIEFAEQNAPRESTKSRFEKAYAESRSLPKRERKSHIRAALKNVFATKDELSAYVERNTERKRTNESAEKSDYTENCICNAGIISARSRTTITYIRKKHSAKNYRTR